MRLARRVVDDAARRACVGCRCVRALHSRGRCKSSRAIASCAIALRVRVVHFVLRSSCVVAPFQRAIPSCHSDARRAARLRVRIDLLRARALTSFIDPRVMALLFGKEIQGVTWCAEGLNFRSSTGKRIEPPEIHMTTCRTIMHSAKYYRV